MTTGSSITERKRVSPPQWGQGIYRAEQSCLPWRDLMVTGNPQPGLVALRCPASLTSPGKSFRGLPVRRSEAPPALHNLPPHPDRAFAKLRPSTRRALLAHPARPGEAAARAVRRGWAARPGTPRRGEITGIAFLTAFVRMSTTSNLQWLALSPKRSTAVSRIWRSAQAVRHPGLPEPGIQRNVLAGLAGLTRRKWQGVRTPALTAYGAFFAGVALTGYGSAWYHLDPANESLVWDHLLMSIAIMGLFSAGFTEHVDPAPDARFPGSLPWAWAVFSTSAFRNTWAPATSDRTPCWSSCPLS
jgi:hypothetical protein